MINLHPRPSESVMPRHGGDRPLLTVASVRAIKADYESDVRLLQEMPARIEQKKRRLEAAMLFLPEGMDLDAVEQEVPDVSQPIAPTSLPAQPALPEPTADVQGGDEPDDTGSMTWAGEMLAQLQAAGRGVSHRELLDGLMATLLRAKATKGFKGFYNAVARLADKGDLVKGGGLLYHKDVAAKVIAEHGQLPDVGHVTRRRAGGSASFIVEALQEHPGGLTGPQLKEIVSSMDGAPKSMREHGQYIYNLLGTLMGNGSVTKQNGLYKLSPEGVT